MGTAMAKQIYKLRCQTAEWVNAQARNRGLYQMPLRGTVKCRLVGLLYAISHNLLMGMQLSPGGDGRRMDKPETAKASQVWQRQRLLRQGR